MRLLLAIALTLLGVPSVAQTPRNVTLLGSFNPAESSSGCWGYRDPATGTELAFLLTNTGTYFMDCTTGVPVQRAYFPGPVSGWREARTYGRHAYIVTEGGGGMQIVDLVNPLAPVLVGTHTLPGWNNTHTIILDEARGHIYCNGATQGMLVFDVAANPTSPPLLATFTGFYVHDGHVQNGYAHLADIFGNRYFIADVSNLPTITVIGQAATPGRRFFHNVWPTRDDAFAVGTNEAGGGPLSIWDVRNKALPILIGQIHPAPTTAVIHHAIPRDNVVHIAYYTEGYIAIDLSVPAQPVVVAQYDTFPGASSGFNGAWGVYPFQPSGMVYLSDIQTGLYVFRTAASVAYYGPTTAGGSGSRPEIHGYGAPYLGNANFQLQCDRAPAGAPGVMLLNNLQSSLNVGGLQLNVDAFGGVPILISLVAGANGKAAVPLPVPTTPQLDGRKLYAQFFFFDVGGPLDLAASQGLELTMFTP
jgi:choice-of-anchor B domain-containing protein